MTDLPTTPDSDRDLALHVIQLLEDNITYSKKNGGNVVIRGSWDVGAKIPSPSIIVDYSSSTAGDVAQDGAQEEIQEVVQLDLFTDSLGAMDNLKWETDKVLLANKKTPGGQWVLIMPGTWQNNSELSQAEGLYRFTSFQTFLKFMGTAIP